MLSSLQVLARIASCLYSLSARVVGISRKVHPLIKGAVQSDQAKIPSLHSSTLPLCSCLYMCWPWPYPVGVHLKLYLHRLYIVRQLGALIYH